MTHPSYAPCPYRNAVHPVPDDTAQKQGTKVSRAEKPRAKIPVSKIEVIRACISKYRH